jgi:battenin
MRDFIIAFWLMGVLNNALFVIMLAGAKSISEGGTALVFIANTLPSLCLKLSAPHWFHLVGYKWRLCGASCLFMSSFCTVAWFAMHKTRTTAGFELIGVALGSVGGSIGEASLLALAGRLDTEHKGSLLTAFSSGTGLAGIFGFGWKTFWNDFLGLSFSRTLLIANVLPMAYATIYLMLLDTARLPVLEDECLDDENVYVIDDADGSHAMRGFGTVRNRSDGVSVRVDSRNSAEGIALMSDPALLGDDMPLRDSNEERRHDQESSSLRPNKSLMELRAGQRFRLVLSLWPYMVPLFLVYFSEYAMMSGVWTAIGFPVDNVEARNKFYLYSSWMVRRDCLVSMALHACLHYPAFSCFPLPLSYLLSTKLEHL